jgi:hypothetical protein
MSVYEDADDEDTNLWIEANILDDEVYIEASEIE